MTVLLLLVICGDEHTTKNAGPDGPGVGKRFVAYPKWMA
jgi:hypothetical protein